MAEQKTILTQSYMSAQESLNSKTVAELKVMAKRSGIQGHSRMLKEQLIDALSSRRMNHQKTGQKINKKTDNVPRRLNPDIIVEIMQRANNRTVSAFGMANRASRNIARSVIEERTSGAVSMRPFVFIRYIKEFIKELEEKLQKARSKNRSRRLIGGFHISIGPFTLNFECWVTRGKWFSLLTLYGKSFTAPWIMYFVGKDREKWKQFAISLGEERATYLPTYHGSDYFNVNNQGSHVPVFDHQTLEKYLQRRDIRPFTPEEIKAHVTPFFPTRVPSRDWIPTINPKIPLTDPRFFLWFLYGMFDIYDRDPKALFTNPYIPATLNDPNPDGRGLKWKQDIMAIFEGKVPS